MSNTGIHPDWWTWQKFNNEVDLLCPLEAARAIGTMRTDGSSEYYRKIIRQGVLDLMRLIPELQKNHETVYFPQDFAEDGHASVGTMPPHGKINSVWYYSYDRRQRYKVVQMAWEDRFDMTTREMGNTLNSDYVTLTAASMTALAMAETINLLKTNGREHVGLIAISPNHHQFYCHPKVCGDLVLSIFWDGQKLDYRDIELTPFEEFTAGVIALYVKAHFYRYIDRDLQQAQVAELEYKQRRSNLYVLLQEKGWIK